MPARKFLFGEPPFRYLATHLVAQDDDFRDDARFILGIDETAFQRLASELAECDSFLDRDRIQAIATPALVGDDSERVTDFVIRISSVLHSAEIELSDAMTQFAEVISDKLEGFSGAERDSLIQRIHRLVVDPAGLARQYKARQLAGAIGCELDEFRLICDVRPIFDRDRFRIEGAIPLTVMRLEYSTPDGDNAVAEVRITEKQLAELAEKIEVAKRKIDTLRGFIAGQNLTIPKTKATVSGD